MPIIWRYLLSHYLKVLCFCVVSFIAVLMTTRLQEIAHFAALGSQGMYVLLFALYQIPYILPIALPVSCLISAMILIKRLSTTYELTALRASGISLKDILTPILLAASILTLANFYVVSEVATDSHLKTRVLEQEIRSINPMLLLENHHLTKLRGMYVNSLGPSHAGISASDLIIAFPNRQNHRLSVMVAKKIETDSLQLIGDKISMINSIDTMNRQHYDHILIENVDNSTTSAEDFSNMLRNQSGSRINTDYLKLSLLQLRAKEDRLELQKAEAIGDASLISFYNNRITRSYSEILRRISLSLAVLTFTLMGTAFGISISRRQSYQGVIWVIGLATLFLVSFFTAKGLDHFIMTASLLYIVPHLIIIACSIRAIKHASKGIE